MNTTNQIIESAVSPWQVWIDRSRAQELNPYTSQVEWLKNVNAKFKIFGAVRWDQHRSACRKVAMWYMYSVLKISTDRIAEMFGLHIVTVHRALPDSDEQKSLSFLRAKRDMIPYLRDITMSGADMQDVTIQVKQIISELSLDTSSRLATTVMKRNIVMLKLFKTGMFTLQELGDIFNRNHSSCIYALRKVESEWNTSTRKVCENEIQGELDAIDRLFIIKT